MDGWIERWVDVLVGVRNAFCLTLWRMGKWRVGDERGGGWDGMRWGEEERETTLATGKLFDGLVGEYVVLWFHG